MKPINVLLVDDNAMWMRVTKEFLDMHSTVAQVTMALSGEEALQSVGTQSHDLVLMDVRMPVLDGLETTRRIKLRPNAPKVVVVSMDDSAELHRAAVQAGADAFLSKSRIGSELARLVDSLFDPCAGAA